MVDVEPGQVERYRDITLDEGGRTVSILARTGGGNRDDYPNAYLTRHPLYVEDHDDDFDCTYAYYTMRLPEQFHGLFSGVTKPPTLHEKFDQAINQLTPETFKKDFDAEKDGKVLAAVELLKVRLQEAINFEREEKGSPGGSR